MKKKRVSQHKSKVFDVANAISQAERLVKEGRYQEALDSWLRIAHTRPGIGEAWGNAAVNCNRLGRWQDAIHYSQNALARGCDHFGVYDLLAHAHAQLGQWDETRRHGLQALNIRARRFGNEQMIPLLEFPPMPPPPSAETRARNIIAFSLFGGNCKYCEPAVLNAQDQPVIYPHWLCRFYVDDSVPENITNRLQENGAQIVRVDGPASEWPG
ncbi:MAG: tetratricopeptide repeat protein, partial [Desulfobulbaceae bacterium]|nr:tetratricopeptide repeat protein [Desulfobulbaceae bacterium]